MEMDMAAVAVAALGNACTCSTTPISKSLKARSVEESVSGTGLDMSDVELDVFSNEDETTESLQQPGMDDILSSSNKDCCDIIEGENNDCCLQIVVEEEIPNKDCGDIIEGEIPDKDCGDIIEGEIPNKDCGDIIEGEIPNKDCGDIVEGESSNKDCGDIIEGEIPNKDCSDIIEEEIPNKDCSDIIEEEIPNKDCGDIIEGEIPNKDCGDIIEGEIPNKDCSDIIEEEIPSKDCSDIIEEEIPNKDCGDIVEDCCESIEAEIKEYCCEVVDGESSNKESPFKDCCEFSDEVIPNNDCCEVSGENICNKDCCEVDMNKCNCSKNGESILNKDFCEVCNEDNPNNNKDYNVNIENTQNVSCNNCDAVPLLPQPECLDEEASYSKADTKQKKTEESDETVSEQSKRGDVDENVDVLQFGIGDEDREDRDVSEKESNICGDDDSESDGFCHGYSGGYVPDLSGNALAFDVFNSPVSKRCPNTPPIGIFGASPTSVSNRYTPPIVILGASFSNTPPICIFGASPASVPEESFSITPPIGILGASPTSEPSTAISHRSGTVENVDCSSHGEYSAPYCVLLSDPTASEFDMAQSMSCNGTMRYDTTRYDTSAASALPQPECLDGQTTSRNKINSFKKKNEEHEVTNKAQLRTDDVDENVDLLLLGIGEEDEEDSRDDFEEESGVCGDEDEVERDGFGYGCDYVPDLPANATGFALFNSPVSKSYANTPPMGILGVSHASPAIVTRGEPRRGSFLSSFLESGGGDFMSRVEMFHNECRSPAAGNDEGSEEREKNDEKPKYEQKTEQAEDFVEKCEDDADDDDDKHTAEEAEELVVKYEDDADDEDDEQAEDVEETCDERVNDDEEDCVEEDDAVEGDASDDDDSEEGDIAEDENDNSESDEEFDHYDELEEEEEKFMRMRLRNVSRKMDLSRMAKVKKRKIKKGVQRSIKKNLLKQIRIKVKQRMRRKKREGEEECKKERASEGCYNNKNGDARRHDDIEVDGCFCRGACNCLSVKEDMTDNVKFPACPEEEIPASRTNQEDKQNQKDEEVEDDVETCSCSEEFDDDEDDVETCSCSEEFDDDEDDEENAEDVVNTFGEEDDEDEDEDEGDDGNSSEDYDHCEGQDGNEDFEVSDYSDCIYDEAYLDLAGKDRDDNLRRQRVAMEKNEKLLCTLEMQTRNLRKKMELVKVARMNRERTKKDVLRTTKKVLKKLKRMIMMKEKLRRKKREGEEYKTEGASEGFDHNDRVAHRHDNNTQVKVDGEKVDHDQEDEESENGREGFGEGDSAVEGDDDDNNDLEESDNNEADEDFEDSDHSDRFYDEAYLEQGAEERNANLRRLRAEMEENEKLLCTLEMPMSNLRKKMELVKVAKMYNKRTRGVLRTTKKDILKKMKRINMMKEKLRRKKEGDEEYKKEGASKGYDHNNNGAARRHDNTQVKEEVDDDHEDEENAGEFEDGKQCHEDVNAVEQDDDDYDNSSEEGDEDEDGSFEVDDDYEDFGEDAYEDDDWCYDEAYVDRGSVRDEYLQRQRAAMEQKEKCALMAVRNLRKTMDVQKVATIYKERTTKKGVLRTIKKDMLKKMKRINMIKESMRRKKKGGENEYKEEGASEGFEHSNNSGAARRHDNTQVKVVDGCFCTGACNCLSSKEDVTDDVEFPPCPEEETSRQLTCQLTSVYNLDIQKSPPVRVKKHRPPTPAAHITLANLKESSPNKQPQRAPRETHSPTSCSPTSYIKTPQYWPSGVEDVLYQQFFKRGWIKQHQEQGIPLNCRRRITVEHCCNSSTSCHARGFTLPQDVIEPPSKTELYKIAVKEGRAKRERQWVYFDSEGRRKKLKKTTFDRKTDIPTELKVEVDDNKVQVQTDSSEKEISIKEPSGNRVNVSADAHDKSKGTKDSAVVFGEILWEFCETYYDELFPL